MVNKEYENYIKDYPALEPCINCTFWRNAGDSILYRPSNYRFIALRYRPNYACHYGLTTGILKTEEDKHILYTEHKCKYFKEVQRRK